MSFRTIRIVLRATKYISILVLARTLYHCVVSSKVAIPDLHPELVGTLTNLTWLICGTLLWSILSFLEPQPYYCSDEFRGDSEDDLQRIEAQLVYERTDVEMIFCWIVAVLWTINLKSLFWVFEVLGADKHSRVGMTAGLSISISFWAIYVMYLQLLFSVVGYARSHGWRELRSGRFWRRRTGWWTRRISLEDEENCEDGHDTNAEKQV